MTIATFVLMGLTLFGAGLAVGLKNILHAIFGLAICLLGVAGLFVVLGSPFVAAMEVLIYVGGISVAMIFAVMLSPVLGDTRRSGRPRRLGAALVSGLFFAGAATVLLQGDVTGHAADLPPALGTPAWDVRQLGTALLGDQVIAFEALSIVLLLAICGAIVIATREPAAAAPDAAPSAEEASS